MKVYFNKRDAFTRDQIALRQLQALRELQGPSEKALRLSDVKRMFILMDASPNGDPEVRAVSAA